MNTGWTPKFAPNMQNFEFWSGTEIGYSLTPQCSLNTPWAKTDPTSWWAYRSNKHKFFWKFWNFPSAGSSSQILIVRLCWNFTPFLILKLSAEFFSFEKAFTIFKSIAGFLFPQFSPFFLFFICLMMKDPSQRLRWSFPLILAQKS